MNNPYIKKFDERLTFDEQLHQYYLDGNPIISVTQLMKKHGLSPDYSFVDSQVLQDAADRGTFIHGEIERLIKTGECGFSQEVNSVAAYMRENQMENIKSEFAVYNEIVAGTVDLFYEQNGVKIIADIKTTSTIHKEAVSWQLSIYNYLSKDKAEVGKCFHFKSDTYELEVIDIPLKSEQEVAELLTNEAQNIRYIPKALFDDNEIAAYESLEDYIADLNEKLKSAQEREAGMKNAIKEQMKARGITSIEQGRLKITLVADTTTKQFDKTSFKNDHPDLYEKYEKTAPKAGYVKITLRAN